LPQIHENAYIFGCIEGVLSALQGMLTALRQISCIDIENDLMYFKGVLDVSLWCRGAAMIVIHDI
jgi:hypothetical protein